MRRSRLTWNKKADNAPATPNEGHDHPADQGQQPVEKYFIDNDGNGVGSEPSDFAEDVHQPPYNKGEEPALPHEGHDHPAMKAAARDIRASVERKASKCIRIAQATLGKTASMEALEDQALAFMNMGDDDVEATLARLSDMHEEATSATSMFAEEDEELEGMMAEFMAEMDPAQESSDELMSDNHEEESMLAEMLGGSEDEEGMLAEMLADQNDPDHFNAESDVEEIVEEIVDQEDVMLAEEGLDAMGLSDDLDELSDGDLLAGLFAGKFASDDEEEKEEEKEEEEEETEAAAKKASRLRPRARKASKGVKNLGNVSKTASSEMNELSKLWETAPNISDLF